jgi:hypothetical protein
MQMPSPALLETVERIRSCAAFDRGSGRRHWLDIIGIRKKDYQAFLSGERELTETSVQGLASYLGVEADSIMHGTVDFRALAVQKGDGRKTLPEAYMVAAFGRRRTTITSFDYIEKRLGWRARVETLRKFKVNEAVLSDPMASINMQFLSDVAEYLHSRYGSKACDFFQMGAYSPVGNRKSLIGEILSTAKSPADAYEILFDGLIKFFEQNTRYTFVRLNDEGCVIDVTSYRYVAEALGLRHLGNRHICELKGGFLASIPLYLGLPLAGVTETQCVHRGDSVCRYEIVFPTSGRLSERNH